MLRTQRNPIQLGQQCQTLSFENNRTIQFEPEINLRALQKESPPAAASLQTDSTLTGKQFPALLNRCSTEAQGGCVLT